MKISKNKLILALLLFFSLFTLFLNHSFSYLDPDLGWHLKAGQNIYLNKEISTDNIYNYTIKNNEWLNHEWLIDLSSFLIYEKFGYILLSIFFSLIATLNIFLLFKLNKIINKKNLSPILIVSLSLLSFFIFSPSSGIRMQTFGYLNIILLLITLFSYERKKNKKILFFLPILFLFWANVHASFLFGFCILFLYLFIELFKKSFLIKYIPFIKKESSLSKNNLISLTIFSFLSFLITFINPFGIKLYSFLFEYRNTSYLSYIQEWLPIFQPPIIYSFMLYLGLFFALLYINRKKIKQEKKIKIFWWILNFITLAMAIKSKRNDIIFLITSFPLLCYFFNIALNEKENIILNKKIKKYANDKFVKLFIAISLILTLSSLIIQTQFCKNPFNFYKKTCPVEAINYIKNNDNLKDLKIFNEYGWGGCLIWTWPEKEIFIDGRMPQTSYEDQTIIEEYMDFKDKEKIEEKIEKHNIQLFLLKQTKEENTFPQSFLESSNNWQQIFENKESIIYVKK